jgi:hypothetical protein
MKLGFCDLKVTGNVGNKAADPYGILNYFD